MSIKVAAFAVTQKVVQYGLKPSFIWTSTGTDGSQNYLEHCPTLLFDIFSIANIGKAC